MTRIIKNFILIMLFVVINAAIAFHLDSFGENIMSYNRLKIFRGQKIIACSFSVSFYNDVSPKLGNGIYNSYNLKKGNGRELSFKPLIKINLFFPRKKMAFRALMLFSKKLVKTLNEVNEEKNDLIILSFAPIKKILKKFKHSIFQSSNGEIYFSIVENFKSRNLFYIQIINNKLFIYFYEKKKTK